MKCNIDLAIFDFDGVIIDSGHDIASAVQYVQKQFARPVLPSREIIGYIGHGVEWLIRRSFKGCSEDIIKQAIPVYRKYYLENAVIATKLYKNVKETLDFIKSKQGIKLGLVTNKPEDLTRTIIAKLEVESYFDMIVGPESVSRLKPDPEGILKVLREFNIPAHRALMTGDSYVDIEAGRNAGTLTCGVTYGLGDTEALVKSSPDILLHDISELLEYIS